MSLFKNHKPKFVVGFTGTQKGMTHRQKKTVKRLLRKLNPDECRHGDCIGADNDFHNLVRVCNDGIKIVIHPPTYAGKRAFCDGDLVLEPKEYLDRNHDIVDRSNVIISTPSSEVEELRSGTWSTVRYTVKMKKEIYIVAPNGSLLEYKDCKRDLDE